MSLSREQMLVEMGISPIWVLREGEQPVAEPVAPPIAVAAPKPPIEPTQTPQPSAPIAPVAPSVAPGTVDIGNLDWPELAGQVATCQACPLCQQRKQAVFGVGDLHPDWLFIGEGPGADEDAQGEPFVGQAGKLLDNMLAALDIARGNKVYIGNAVKCRPPGNRTPEAAELAACRPYLERQIALLKPKIIVLLGKVAVHSVLHDDKSLASLRGKRFEYAGIPVVVTYHPAYLLRNLPDKAKAWEDLLFARRVLREAASPELPF
ncbi:MAG TPA: uracil-DNA glycosylase family protein [Azonexus sp.]|nr:uracil-DNA glycosylase family protein [Azonexus sp.]